MQITDEFLISLLFRRTKQLCLPLLRFDMYKLRDEIIKNVFLDRFKDIDLVFVRQDTLACIVYTIDNSVRPTIFIHEILNHPNTPVNIISFIIKHELLHLLIDGREINGKYTSHPPEFLETELKISPEYNLMYSWILLNIGFYVKFDKEREGIYIKKNWKQYFRTGKISLGQIQELKQRFDDRIAL